MTTKYNVKEIANLLKTGSKAVNQSLKKAGFQVYDEASTGLNDVLKWKLTPKGAPLAERCSGVALKTGRPYDMWIWDESVVETLRPLVAASTAPDTTGPDTISLLSSIYSRMGDDSAQAKRIERLLQEILTALKGK